METNTFSEFTGTEKPQGFLIVGIGASAGGIQALKDFFQHVPADSGMAYVVILHLSPDHDSRLAQVLQVVCAIPVLQVTESTKIEPNHVYVVPPNQHLVLTDGYIAPSVNMHIEDRRAPVDIFFRNLADTHGPRAVCVVLSGTGANGSMGLKRIKERGGVAYVQNPREAEYNEMPRNSIATELVDAVLPVAEIPACIIAYRDSLGTVQIVVEAEKRPEQQQQALREIFTQLRVRTGHDFSNYKRPTLLRRIERRINVRNLPDLPSYTAFLHEHPDETHALLKDLLISVTNFFRDSKSFEGLERNVLPAIFAGKTSADQVRIWVAGCATGEEAYSIAMLCAERTLGAIDTPKVQIFATDIDESAIATAREGFYTLNDAADISPDRLRRFFNRDGDGYRVRREIREMILFAHHNFLKDPPFSRLDLVTCRNVLIYLNNSAQERVIETFHFALQPKGFLFLGTSESVDGASDLYAIHSRDHHIFQAREASARNYPVPESVPTFHFPKNTPLQKPEEKEGRSQRISFGDLHQKLLEQYAPPSVIVNEEYEIVHMSERAGKYFEFSGGEPTQNLLKLIRSEIRLELRSALYQAVQHKTAVEARNVKLVVNGQPQSLNIHIRPVLQDGDTARGFILVIFKQNEEALLESETVMMASDEPVARQLEEELIRLKSQLRSSVEQHEFQAEELKASNEELQAMNEELRSAAEELETSKEELQSINEELRTVNQELKVKIDETSLVSNNLQNLINSADVGTIFLDRSFCIRLFTPAMLGIFNLKSADYGRPITDITHKLQYDSLVNDAQTVLEKLSLIEREVTTADNQHFMMRLLPYRTAEDRINGVVITFFDVTKRKDSEDSLRISEEKYRSLFNSIDQGFCIIKVLFDAQDKPVDYRFLEANHSFENQTGLANAVGKTMKELVPAHEQNWFDIYGKIAKTGEPTRFENEAKGLGHYYEVYAFRIGKPQEHRVAVLFNDITERKEAEQRQAFLLKLNDALRPIADPLAIQAVAADLLGQHLHVNQSHYGETTDDYVYIYHSYGDGLAPMTGRFRHQDFGERLVKGYRTGRVQVCYDTTTDQTVSGDERAVLVSAHIGAYVAMPLVKGGEWVATLAVHNIEPRNWKQSEIDLVQEVAERTWAAVERARVQKALRKSEARLQLALEAAGMGTSVWYPMEDRSEPDEHFLKLFGLGESKTINRSEFLAEMIHPDDRGLYSDLVAKASDPSGDGRLYAEIRVVHLDKSIHWVAITGQTVFDGDPSQAVHMYGTAADITERKKADDALRESEEAFRSYVTASSDIVYKMSAEWKTLTNLEGKGFLVSATHPTTSWMDIYIPEHQREKVQEAIDNAIQTKTMFELEHQVINARHGLSWVYSRAVPRMNEQGEIIEWIGAASDITERKQAEEALRNSEAQLRLIIESAKGFAIFTTDAAGVINSWNAGAAEIFGWQEEEIIGQNANLLFTPEDRAAGQPQMEMQTATDNGMAPDVRWHLCKDGSLVFITGFTHPVYDMAGTLTGFVKIGRDITVQHNAEVALRKSEDNHRITLEKEVEQRTAELKESNTNLRYANENLQQFASIASHDLQEPLRKLKLFVSVLKRFNEGLPKEGKEVLHKIGATSERMSQLISEVLQYSKIAYGAKEFIKTDMNTILQNVLGDLDLMIKDTGASVKQQESLPEIEAIPLQMNQLLYNLLTNALKFRREGIQPQICISASFLPPNISKAFAELKANKSYIELVITDNGIGFNEQYAEQIFQIFERLHSVDEYEGTGVGLALCKKIVENHSGHIYTRSKEGEGASFHVLLPLRQ